MKKLVLGALILVSTLKANAQGCCSGGSGSPIAGGVSQGVLQANQLELASNYQYLSTNKFKSKDKSIDPLFDKLYSNYLYTRLAFGVSEKFTFSAETGYFFNKTQYSLRNRDTIESKGFGDLILMPRYQVFFKTTPKNKTEVVLGLGLKMPIGKYNDSTLIYTNPKNGRKYFTTSPPTVQPTSGSNDLIFYAFFSNEFRKQRIKTFANVLYMKKGWNALGQNFGDYASLGLFINKSFYRRFNATLQLRGEMIGKMDYDKKIDMLAQYNIDVNSTGTRSIFLSPQLSYSVRSLTTFIMTEIPLYQYANGTQVVSQCNLTAGINYRIFPFKKKEEVE
jgi:hypothetical protein